MALFVRKDNETEQIPTESNGVSRKRKRKNPIEDTAEELSFQLTNKDRNEGSSLPLAHFMESSGNNLSPRKKRKRNKKLKDLKAQEENQLKTSRGNLGLSNFKKKKKRKKKKKVSVCS